MNDWDKFDRNFAIGVLIVILIGLGIGVYSIGASFNEAIEYQKETNEVLQHF